MPSVCLVATASLIAGNARRLRPRCRHKNTAGVGAEAGAAEDATGARVIDSGSNMSELPSKAIKVSKDHLAKTNLGPLSKQ